MQTYEIKRLYGQNAPQEEILNAYKTAFAENGNGEELITLAANFADVRALRFLTEAGVDPLVQDDYKHTLLHVLAKLDEAHYNPPSNEDIKASVEFLLEQRVSVLRKDENRYMCCYHYAAETGNYPFVAALAQHGAKFTMTDKEGNTAIHIACDYVRHKISSIKYAEEELEKAKRELAETAIETWKARCEERVKKAEEELKKINDLVENYFLLVKTFVENGVDKDEKNQYGKTALEMAVKANAKKIAAYLNGENVDEASIKTGGMNLHQAVLKGDLEAIAALLQNGADPNALLDGEPTDESKNYIGCTPLATACDYKNPDAVKLLLQNGALPSLKNGEGKAPVAWLASTAARVSMEKVYKEKRIPQILKALVEAGCKIDETVDDEANTLITYALKYAGHSYINHFLLKAVIVEEALRYRPNLNLANHEGQTPLMLVCREDADEMENLLLSLLENGADVNLKDSEGNTALHYAARNSQKNTAKTFCGLLLDFNASAALANNAEQTAMDIAVETENEPLVKLLLNNM